MSAKLLLAATAVLLAGTTMASAQALPTYMYIQSRDYIESVHGLPFSVYARQNHFPGYFGYGAYGFAPRYYNNRYSNGY
jgi:hypothetical protein